MDVGGLQVNRPLLPLLAVPSLACGTQRNIVTVQRFLTVCLLVPEKWLENRARGRSVILYTGG